MSFFDTKYKRKSFVITSILHILLLLLFFFAGMTYQEPPPEYGVAVNFGTSTTGSGYRQPKKSVKIAPKPQKKTKTTIAKEKIATQDFEEAPVIEKKKKKTTKTSVKNKQKENPRPTPKPSKEAVDALSNILGAAKTDTAKNKSEGDEKADGDKGNQKGNPDAKGYYNNSDGSGSGNYQLGNRTPLTRPKPIYDCDEQGRVVVRIIVNREGKVVFAEAGVKGTTNSHPCLLRRAEQAAKMTLWQSDDQAPARQHGRIIYNFHIKN